jgi:hypothetical protein
VIPLRPEFGLEEGTGAYSISTERIDRKVEGPTFEREARPRRGQFSV